MQILCKVLLLYVVYWCRSFSVDLLIALAYYCFPGLLPSTLLDIFL